MEIKGMALLLHQFNVHLVMYAFKMPKKCFLRKKRSCVTCALYEELSFYVAYLIIVTFLILGMEFLNTVTIVGQFRSSCRN